MNEHIYRLNDYLRAARAANLKARVLFPADLEKQLNGTIPPPTPLIVRCAACGAGFRRRYAR
jgi:hypothetical protein